MIPELLTIEAAARTLGREPEGLARRRGAGGLCRADRKEAADRCGETRGAGEQMSRRSKGVRITRRETRATGTSGTAKGASRPGPMIEDELTKSLPATSPNKVRGLDRAPETK